MGVMLWWASIRICTLFGDDGLLFLMVFINVDTPWDNSKE